LNPDTIGEREERTTGGASVGEDDGNKLRSEVIEMIGGFGLEKFENLLLCGALRTSSDDAENNLEREWG
jgi:hypothetical protein